MPGSKDHEILSAGGADRRDLQRGGDDSAQTGALREERETDCILLRRSAETDALAIRRRPGW